MARDPVRVNGETLAQFDTPTVCNAIEKLGLRPRTQGFAELGMKHVTPELGVMCGVCVTATAVSMESDMPEREKAVSRYLEICDHLTSCGGRGVVVIQEKGGARDFCVHCGDVMATLFAAHGAIGLISDCAVRDIRTVGDMGFHLFARGMAASHGNFHIVDVQVPVSVCGVDIEPGDLVHGDLNGLTVVPRDCDDQLIVLAHEVADRESRLRAAIQSGVSRSELARILSH